MGNMYTNITLRGPNRDSVLAYLDARALVAYVTAPQEGYVVVYDQASDTQEEAILTARTEQLSRQFNCAALAVLNHDDDILVYWLYENGTQIDKYDSAPGYFTGEDSPPAGGRAATLCRVFGVDSSKTGEIETLLRAPSDVERDFPITEFMNTVVHFPDRLVDLLRRIYGVDGEGIEDVCRQIQSTVDYACALDRHDALVKALGLPDCVVGFGFDYLDRGDVPDGLTRDDLRRTGPTV